MPARNQCLFLFQELYNALRFYSKYGGNIYEVSIIGKTLFRGDMNKLDNVLDLLRLNVEDYFVISAVNEYWKGGTHTFSPCYEILCERVKVERIMKISPSPEKFNQELCACDCIEQTNTYIKLLQEVSS